jgi:hypothetical protein
MNDEGTLEPLGQELHGTLFWKLFSGFSFVENCQVYSPDMLHKEMCNILSYEMGTVAPTLVNGSWQFTSDSTSCAPFSVNAINY